MHVKKKRDALWGHSPAHHVGPQSIEMYVQLATGSGEMNYSAMTNLGPRRTLQVRSTCHDSIHRVASPANMKLLTTPVLTPQSKRNEAIYMYVLNIHDRFCEEGQSAFNIISYLSRSISVTKKEKNGGRWK